MITTKSLGIGVGIATGAAGLTGLVGYSAGLFNSNIQISKLLEQENKYALLPADSIEYTTEWNEAWEKYTDNTNNKWKIPDEIGVTATIAPQSFKDICQRKATERVKDKTDQKYIDITNYCSRPKKLSEVLSKEGIELLETAGKETEWKAKFNSYKTSSNQIPNVTAATANDGEEQFTKLRDSCKAAVARKTTDNNYSETYAAVKEWCKV